MSSDIIYGEDIVSNVARKLKIPESRVQVVFDFLFWFIRKKSKEPEVFSIKLPKVGKLYLCTEKQKKVLLERDKRDTVSQKQRKGHRASLEKLETFEKIFKEKAGDKYVRTVHKKGANIHNYFWNKGKTFKELEEIQNSNG